MSTKSEQSTEPNGLPEREQTQKDQMQLRGMCEGVHCSCPGTQGAALGSSGEVGVGEPCLERCLERKAGLKVE